jgi:alpha-L-fucosidase 2
LEDDYHHRHSSHLYPVFPGFEVGREETPELYQACLKAAQLRLTDGIEAITGWGLAHLANISARLKDRDLCYQALRRIIQKFLLPNLFTCHNEGELFQMDANLGFSAAILEMLVFSKPGWIELFPALPQEISKGCISGVCCRGQITLSYLKWDMAEGRVCVELKSSKNQTISLKLPCKTEHIELPSAPATDSPADRLSDDLHIMSGQGSDILKLHLAKEYTVQMTIRLRLPE